MPPHTLHSAHADWCLQSDGLPDSPLQVIDVKNVHLETVFDALGEALTVLITLDEITMANPLIRDHWTLYKRMMKTVRSNVDTFGVDRDQLPSFEKWILALESKVHVIGLVQPGLTRRPALPARLPPVCLPSAPPRARCASRALGGVCRS